MNQSRPKAKISRALGIPLTPKCVKYFERRPFPPGVHGRSRRKESDYKVRLLEKQRLRHQYNVSETQLRRAFDAAHRSSGKTGERLLASLETRLDALVLRAGFARTIYQARQTVAHGHIAVDGPQGRPAVVPGPARTDDHGTGGQPVEDPVPGRGRRRARARAARAVPGDVRSPTCARRWCASPSAARSRCSATSSSWWSSTPGNRGGAALRRVRDNAQRDRTHRRPAVAGPDPGLHRPRRAAQAARLRAGDLLRGLRPDRAEPARRQPDAGPHRPPAAARRPPAAAAGRRRDRADRRPQGEQRAHAQPARGGGGLGGADPRPGRAVRHLHRRQRGHAGQQPGLDRADVGDRVPARRRQALPGQPDAGPRGGPGAAGDRHQLHRVQLPAAAGARLLRAAPAVRLHAAVRRLRPVGQHHRRRRLRPPAGRRDRCTPS